jgi:hypothetical protein
MARDWKARPAPKPTSITECARRYHAAAWALAQSLGLSLQETLAHHRESVTAIFIEVSKCEVRLPAGVQLPPLVTTNGQGECPEKPLENQAVSGPPAPNDQAEPMPAASEEFLSDVDKNSDQSPEPPLPLVVPTGLPCSGQRVTDLRPAQLRMLLSRVDQLAAEQGSRWRPLLESLAAERARRVAAGRKGPVLVRGDGHGG